MLRIVDYAKRKDVEWYEVIRQTINEASAAPVAILTRGELRVYELDEDEMIGDYPEFRTNSFDSCGVQASSSLFG